MATHQPEPDRLQRHEALFTALMALERCELVQHVRTTPKTQLPAEVLARSYRDLWLAGRNEEAEAVAARLFGSRNEDPPSGVGDPEYMRWLLVHCEKRVSLKSVWRAAEDLYQSTCLQIVRALRGSQGAQAHTAWRAFCFDRLYDALRERTRRDAHVVGLEVQSDETGELRSLADVAESHPWQGSVAPDREEALTAFLRQRLELAADPVVRDIGLDQFFGDPSPVDEPDPERPDRPPLTLRYRLTRFQVYQRKKKAKVVLRRAWEEWTEQNPQP
ncbi:MAG TPA: hypothetical protein VGR37_20515 [Longimicrobiaceae bacterium]|nr:hypothetical protein [Longimicrobiaceae bacterium]